jgi:hypothetical protein
MKATFFNFTKDREMIYSLLFSDCSQSEIQPGGEAKNAFNKAGNLK